MSEQRTPSQTPAQHTDADPKPTEASKRQEREPTVPNFEDVSREEAVEQRVGVQSEGGTGRIMEKRVRQANKGGEAEKPAAKQSEGGTDRVVRRRTRQPQAKKPAAKQSKKASSDGGGRGKVERSEKPVGVGGDGGGAAEGNGQGREAVVIQQGVVPDPPGVAVPPTADAPPADAPPADAPSAARRNPGEATVEEMLALRAQLAALEEIQAALIAAKRDGERQAQSDAQQREQELQNVRAEAERQLKEMRQLMQQAQSEAQQRVVAAVEAARAEGAEALRDAGEVRAAAERQLEEARQAAQRELQNVRAEAERQREGERQAAQRELQNVQAAAMLELEDARRNAARSPAPNAEGGVVPGGGEEDEDGGGEELPRMSSSRNASYAAAAADGRIPNDIGPLARVIETDPRWGTGRRGDFEDTPNIGSIEQRRYNRSAGNILYEQNFPIGNFASVRVPMPRGTPQTLALFGRNAHVATPAQSINRAIMRYEGRGVYR